MSHRLAFKSANVENYKGGDKHSFDRVAISENGELAVLCDGANSSPMGGQCASICSAALCEELGKAGDLDDANQRVYDHVNGLIQRNVTGSGCTALSLQFLPKALRISGVGDSIAEIYRRGIWGWRLAYRTEQQLIVGTMNPSQLMGCPAYSAPFHKEIDAPGRYAVLMMSDGMYNFTSPLDRLRMVQKIKTDTPSVHDLEYLLSDLAETAIANHANDDVSGVLCWARYK
jgi:serine/threonine protein phosphatase PrpC